MTAGSIDCADQESVSTEHHATVMRQAAREVTSIAPEHDSADSSTIAAEHFWTRSAVGLLIGLLIARFAYLLICPLTLIADEAYYWDWSRQLDLGYYSKPPMIAWLIRLATDLAGDTTRGVRWPAPILSTIGLWPVFLLARQMFNARVGFWSLVLLVANPGGLALGLLMTIDAPFLCCWCFTLWFVWQLVSVNRPKPALVAGAILATGLGLLTKQTMLGVFPLTLLFLLVNPDRRPQLTRSAIWIWLGTSLLFLTPVVWWNAHHDWRTVAHTADHFDAATRTAWDLIRFPSEFLAGQLGIVSPITWLLFVQVMAYLAWSARRLDQRGQFLLIFSAVPLVGVACLSLTRRVQANWPAPFYVTGLILVTGALLAAVPWSEPASAAARAWFDERRNRFRRWFRPAWVSGVAIFALVAIVPLVVPQTPLAGTAWDPTFRLRGWAEVAREVDRIRQEVDLPADTKLIAQTGRGPVSLLAFYLQDQPRVYRWNPEQVADSQHEVWGGPQSLNDETVLIMTEEDSQVEPEIAAELKRLVPLGEAVTWLGASRRLRFRLFRGDGLDHWPEFSAAGRQRFRERRTQVAAAPRQRM